MVRRGDRDGRAICGRDDRVVRQAPYPGWSAVPVTVGSLLLIAAGRDAWLNRVILANPFSSSSGSSVIRCICGTGRCCHFSRSPTGRPGRASSSGPSLSFALASLTYGAGAPDPPDGLATDARPAGDARRDTAIVTLAAFVAYRFELLSPRVPRMASVADDYRGASATRDAGSGFPAPASSAMSSARAVT